MSFRICRAAICLIPWLVLAEAASAQPPFGPGGRGEQNAQLVAEAKAQTEVAANQMHAYLNEISYAQLAKRADVVAAIQSKEQAEQRQAVVRQTIIDLVGGIPAATGPVVVKMFETIQADGFRIENIAYESFPGYWVTANVYVPLGDGPFPAMVIAPGHGAGKSSQYSWGACFASAGILVLSIDPMGQGERMQHWDHELGSSKTEGSGDHEHANQTSLLIGTHIARYWFADGIRGVDYLIQRSDVIADRIGTFGCSGGGTAAAYLAAIDSRIRVAAISSFITSFKELLPGSGPQDAEQTLNHFIGAGLDFADWVEQAAPRPIAIVAFEQDFFPIAGAKWTYEEARRFYSLYGAEDQIELIHGQGGHCNLGPVTPQLLGFLFRHLKGPEAEIPEFAWRFPPDSDALTVTPTGQISTSLDGDTAEDIARKDAIRVMPESNVIRTAQESAEVRARVRHDIRSVAAVTAGFNEVPEVTVSLQQQLDDYRVDTVTFESEPGIVLQGLVGVPSQPGPHPAIVWMDPASPLRTIASPDFIRLVRAGNVVLVVQPRGVFGEPPENPSQLALGHYMPELLRAIVVGKTIVGMRVDDTVRIINWLVARPDVDARAVTLYGTGGLGMVSLHAAALDDRVSKVVIERSLLSYRTALNAGLHKNLSEVVIPGVLKHYDVVELLQTIHPRSVTIVNPANAMGQSLRTQLAKDALAVAFESDQNLGTPERIQILRRGFRDAIPLD